MLPLSQVRGVSVEGSVDKLCHALESSVDRPVVNESSLKGDFVFDVKATPGGENDFLERLKNQLGIVITPAQRDVDVVTVKPR